MLSLQMPAVIG